MRNRLDGHIQRVLVNGIMELRTGGRHPSELHSRISTLINELESKGKYPCSKFSNDTMPSASADMIKEGVPSKGQALKNGCI